MFAFGVPYLLLLNVSPSVKIGFSLHSLSLNLKPSKYTTNTISFWNGQIVHNPTGHPKLNRPLHKPSNLWTQPEPLTPQPKLIKSGMDRSLMLFASLNST